MKRPDLEKCPHGSPAWTWRPPPAPLRGINEVDVPPPIPETSLTAPQGIPRSVIWLTGMLLAQSPRGVTGVAPDQRRRCGRGAPPRSRRACDADHKTFWASCANSSVRPHGTVGQEGTAAAATMYNRGTRRYQGNIFGKEDCDATTCDGQEQLYSTKQCFCRI
jgi:hypothetical protein